MTAVEGNLLGAWEGADGLAVRAATAEDPAVVRTVLLADLGLEDLGARQARDGVRGSADFGPIALPDGVQAEVIDAPAAILQGSTADVVDAIAGTLAWLLDDADAGEPTAELLPQGLTIDEPDGLVALLSCCAAPEQIVSIVVEVGNETYATRLFLDEDGFVEACELDGGTRLVHHSIDTLLVRLLELTRLNRLADPGPAQIDSSDARELADPIDLTALRPVHADVTVRASHVADGRIEGGELRWLELTVSDDLVVIEATEDGEPDLQVRDGEDVFRELVSYLLDAPNQEAATTSP